jgi:hypothetical protein
LALSRRDGSLMLGQFTADRHLHQLVETALQVGGDAPTRDAARLLLEPQKPKKKKKAAPLPLPGLQCDTARIGLLRTDWSAAATSMAVRYNTADVELEMHRCGAMLLRGAWSLEIAVDGQRVQLQRPWENVCWVSDEDVDYLELEGRFGCGLRVQRQMLLARQENFLYLADAIVASSASELVYRSALPLVDGVSCQPAEETREIQLRASQPIGMALPLALPEWRRDPRGGALSAESGGLELKQSRSGRSLYAPLWIDLDRKRSRKPLTWRQLTIAQDRRIVSGEVAVGYRVQFGRKQWLIYRSLAERANRTLLGSNLVSEFMLARFKPEGEAEPLLEIE